MSQDTQELSVSSKGSALAIAGVAAWALLVGAGLYGLNAFKTAPGLQQAAPRLWPAGSRLSLQPGNSTLVLFLHPRCVCSRATLAELGVILSGARNLTARVVFSEGAEGVASLEGTELWESARRIPGVSVSVDRGGKEAKLLGARTSGQLLLYDAAGRLRFSGGITGSRGHPGDNMGRRAVQDLIAGKPTRFSEHAVFGCALDTPGAA